MRTWINVIAVVLLVPFALAHAFRTAIFDKLARLSLVAMLTTFIVLSGWFVYRYDVLYESYRDFDRNLYFDR